MMATRYTHTNLVAHDPDRLAGFYEQVFDCVRDADRHHAGEWLERGMGLAGVRVHAIHLRLPGLGDAGPTLEVFGLEDFDAGERPVPNRTGWMHIAFAVDDIRAALERFLAAGGETLGTITQADVEGVGRVEFMYGRDPEGNIVELQEYK